MLIFLFILGAYILGSLPFGLTIGKIFYHKDVREFGSKNVGATNVWRVCGWKAGLPAFLLDMCKGLLPVLAAKHWYPNQHWLPVILGVTTILGHTFSVFLKFKGGKGVATSLGVAFGLSWQAALVAFLLWAVILAATGFVSLGSILCAPIGGFLLWQFNHRELPYGLFGLLVAFFVLFTHRQNVSRLMAGTESRFRRFWEKKPGAIPTEAQNVP